MEVVGIIVGLMIAVAVGVGRLLIAAMRQPDEQLTWAGVRRYRHKVRDERRERRAMKVYARRNLSPLWMRLGPLQQPRIGDEWRMRRLTRLETRSMDKMYARHRLRNTPEYSKIAGEDLLVAAADHAQRRWGARVEAMWAVWRDGHAQPNRTRSGQSGSKARGAC